MSKVFQSQEICDNSGWMGGYEESTKKWTPPKKEEPRKTGEAWKESDDWMGGGSSSNLNFSPLRRESKPQIKIDGLRSSIKENPFLKNNK